MRKLWPLLFLSPFLLGGCTLSTFPRTVELKLTGDAGTRTARFSRSGPELSAMKCYGVVVAGAPGAVTQAQLGQRDPTCLGMDGAFFGPYSYSEMTSGIAMSLTASTHTFSIIGFDGVTDCAGGLGTLYTSSFAAQNFAVGSPVTANLATASTISIDAGSYVAANAVDRSPSCPVQSIDCSGAGVCDRFVDSNTTQLLLHTPDISLGGWVVTGAATANILGNQLYFLPSNSTGISAVATLNINTLHHSASAIGILGQMAGQSAIGLVLRYSGPGTYARGELTRYPGLGVCHLDIVEVVGGSETIVAAGADLPYPTACPYEVPLRMDFSYDGSYYALQVGSYQLSGNSFGLTGGVQVGISAGRYGNNATMSRFTIFRGDTLP